MGFCPLLPVAFAPAALWASPDIHPSRITASDPHGRDTYDYAILVTEN